MKTVTRTVKDGTIESKVLHYNPKVNAALVLSSEPKESSFPYMLIHPETGLSIETKAFKWQAMNLLALMSRYDLTIPRTPDPEKSIKDFDRKLFCRLKLLSDNKALCAIDLNSPPPIPPDAD